MSRIPPPSKHWNESITDDELQALIDTLQTSSLQQLSPGNMKRIRSYRDRGYRYMIQLITGYYADQDKFAMWKGLIIPYEDLPLHINSLWLGERMIVKWRLKINR